jgi:hypothetical protein
MILDITVAFDTTIAFVNPFEREWRWKIVLLLNKKRFILVNIDSPCYATVIVTNILLFTY